MTRFGISGDARGIMAVTRNWSNKTRPGENKEAGEEETHEQKTRDRS
jgi:hypothetical protein